VLDNLPEGFVSFDAGTGFGAVFGPVYVHRQKRQIGFRVAIHHMNPYGALHGGAMATFADMQCVAINQDIAPSGHTPTINLSIDYLAPVRLHEWVLAEVSLLKTTSTMVFTQAIFSSRSMPVARSHAIYRRYASRVRAAAGDQSAT
jgi:uncharacterized protein (TIGR00369 family)